MDNKTFAICCLAIASFTAIGITAIENGHAKDFFGFMSDVSNNDKIEE